MISFVAKNLPVSVSVSLPDDDIWGGNSTTTEWMIFDSETRLVYAYCGLIGNKNEWLWFLHGRNEVTTAAPTSNFPVPTQLVFVLSRWISKDLERLFDQGSFLLLATSHRHDT